MSETLPRTVRSTYGTPGERLLTWRDDELQPYCFLDGYKIIAAEGPAFTTLVNKKGGPIGRVIWHPSLASALSVLGWEAV